MSTAYDRMLMTRLSDLKWQQSLIAARHIKGSSLHRDCWSSLEFKWTQPEPSFEDHERQQLFNVLLKHFQLLLKSGWCFASIQLDYHGTTSNGRTQAMVVLVLVDFTRFGKARNLFQGVFSRSKTNKIQSNQCDDLKFFLNTKCANWSYSDMDVRFLVLFYSNLRWDLSVRHHILGRLNLQAMCKLHEKALRRRPDMLLAWMSRTCYFPLKNNRNNNNQQQVPTDSRFYTAFSFSVTANAQLMLQWQQTLLVICDTIEGICGGPVFLSKITVATILPK